MDITRGLFYWVTKLLFVQETSDGATREHLRHEKAKKMQEDIASQYTILSFMKETYVISKDLECQFLSLLLNSAQFLQRMCLVLFLSIISHKNAVFWVFLRSTLSPF